MEINYLAVLVAAVVSMAVGFFWYSPAGFGKAWMAAMGYDDAKLKELKEKGSMNKIYTANLVGELVMAFVLANFIGTAAVTTAVAGAQIGFWAWLGFVAVIMLGGVLWEEKPMRLFYINASYRLVGLLLMGAILAII